jgi:hypothetical protein
MDHTSVARWVSAYERLWRSPGTDGLVGLVDYQDPRSGRWRDLWVLDFADDERCAAF